MGKQQRSGSVSLQAEPARFLAATGYLDHDSAAVRAFAARAAEGGTGPVAEAEALFYAVRDGIRYDPYRVSRDPAAYCASAIAAADSNWCVPKSVLLVACVLHATCKRNW